MTTGGLPHSDISGSQPVYDSPELFAVHHVLHRRNAPRHPPYALLFLDSVVRICLLLSCVSDTPFSRKACQHLSLYHHHVILSVKERDILHQYAVCRHLVTRLIHGDERDRTADPLLARQVLSQLSYAPDVNLEWAYLDLNQGPHAYQACALNQLSYRPNVVVQSLTSLEPPPRAGPTDSHFFPL
jgi:hypothetical protein